MIAGKSVKTVELKEAYLDYQMELVKSKTLHSAYLFLKGP